MNYKVLVVNTQFNIVKCVFKTNNYCYKIHATTQPFCVDQICKHSINIQSIFYRKQLFLES